MKDTRVYTFEELTSLVGSDMRLETGKYHCEINISDNGNMDTFTFIFTEPRGTPNITKETKEDQHLGSD